MEQVQSDKIKVNHFSRWGGRKAVPSWDLKEVHQ